MLKTMLKTLKSNSVISQCYPKSVYSKKPCPFCRKTGGFTKFVNFLWINCDCFPQISHQFSQNLTDQKWQRFFGNPAQSVKHLSVPSSTTHAFLSYICNNSKLSWLILQFSWASTLHRFPKSSQPTQCLNFRLFQHAPSIFSKKPSMPFQIRSQPPSFQSIFNTPCCQARIVPN